MKIKSISLAWFRGAADLTELNTEGKSLLIYGENGSGKSSFVDAVEYFINNGRITHLAHEYSGKKQERAIINTHIPGSQNCTIKLEFNDNSTIESKIAKNGSFTLDPIMCPISNWAYRRTILRQNEVSDFITDTKLGKYSALLPLLGLNHLEIAAENIRKLIRQLPIISSYDSNRNEINRLSILRSKVFGNLSGEEIRKEIELIFVKYFPDETSGIEITKMLATLSNFIDTKVKSFTEEQKRHSILTQLSDIQLGNIIENTINSALDLIDSNDPLILEKLKIIEDAKSFANKSTENTYDCPACGRNIEADQFKAHLASEESLLKVFIDKSKKHTNNINSICDTIIVFKKLINDELIKDWRNDLNEEYLVFIYNLDSNHLRQNFTSEALTKIDEVLSDIIREAKTKIQGSNTDISELVREKEKVDTLIALKELRKLKETNQSVDKLVKYFDELQKYYRSQIKVQSSTIIATISDEISKMWQVLHPDEPIEDVRLLFPNDTDKAIEIVLKFYGKEMDSPRLTLSEGHRNSLGLCIFLAMAKSEENRPILLDDVVVSFDRNHRGRLGFLLEQEFSQRQVLLFTHERDWYIELKKQLDPAHWDFKTLMPWESPDLGIRFSLKQYSFDDARSMIDLSPDSAGNTARKIMDISIAILAESLKISLPYLHRERNDHRVAHEFLEAMTSKQLFMIQAPDGNYSAHSIAIDDLRLADRLLISWGNRASHDFNLAKREAKDLIDICERTLNHFRCEKCNTDVSRVDDSKSSFKQCRCGQLRWKY